MMKCYSVVTIFAVLIAMASARPQFRQNFNNPQQGNQFSPNQDFQNQQQDYYPFIQNQNSQDPYNQNQNSQDPFNQNQYNQNQNLQDPNQNLQGQFAQNQGSQNQQNANQQLPNQQQPQTGTAAVTPAPVTLTPEFINCTRNVCLTTNEYNPVCGSDNVSYQNARKMECANRCGQNLDPNWRDVTFDRNGSCSSGQRVA